MEAKVIFTAADTNIVLTKSVYIKWKCGPDKLVALRATFAVTPLLWLDAHIDSRRRKPIP